MFLQRDVAVGAWYSVVYVRVLSPKIVEELKNWFGWKFCYVDKDGFTVLKKYFRRKVAW